MNKAECFLVPVVNRTIVKGTFLLANGVTYECIETSTGDNVIYVKGGGHLVRENTEEIKRIRI